MRRKEKRRQKKRSNNRSSELPFQAMLHSSPFRLDDVVERKPQRAPTAKAKGATNGPSHQSDDDDDDDDDAGRRGPPPAVEKAKKKTEKPALVNTDFSSASASASASSSSSFFSVAGDQRCSTDFLFGVKAKVTKAAAVKFTSDSRSNFTVNLGKASTEIDTIDDTVEKLVSRFEKYDVFKKKSSNYKPDEHGPLHLIGFYGQIQFSGAAEWPTKLSALDDLVEANHERHVQFVGADLNTLHFDQVCRNRCSSPKHR